MNRVFRLVVCFTFSFSIGSPRLMAYEGAQSAFLPFQAPQPLPNASRNKQPNFDFLSPRLSPFSSFFQTGFRLNLQTARLSGFDVMDVGDKLWHYDIDHLAFDEGRLVDFAADLTPPSGEKLLFSLNRLRYDPGKITPSKQTQTYQDASGNILTKTRTQQVVTENPSFASFESYAKKTYPELMANPSQSLPAKLGLPPSQELTRGFKEKWIYRPSQSKNSTQSKVKTNLSIQDMAYEKGRSLSGYGGTIKQGNQTINFSVNISLNEEGEVNAIKAKMASPGAPSTDVTWTRKEGVDPNKSFALFRDNLPIPLLIGPHTKIRLNGKTSLQAGTDILTTPLKTTPEGTLTSNQLAKPQDLANLQGKESLGITVNASPTPDDTSGSKNISLGSLLRDFGYLLIGRLDRAKKLRTSLKDLRKTNPIAFLLSAGFRNPRTMSLEELEKSLKQAETKQSEEPSRKKDKKGSSFISVFFNIVTQPLRLAGYTIGTVSKLPLVKETILAQRILSGAIIGVVSGDLFERSFSITFDKIGPAVVTINGMKNNDEAAKVINDYVKKVFGIKEATKIKNDTKGIVLDTIQSLGYEYLGSIDKPVWDTVKSIRKGIREKGEVYVVAHSQGSGIFKQALSLLSEDERSKIHYLGIGSQWFIDKEVEGLASAHNEWIMQDSIPILGNKLKLITNVLFMQNWGRLKYDNVLERDGEDLNIQSKKEAHTFEAYKIFVEKWIIQRRSLWNINQLAQ